jgi:hypothetical protein
MMSPVGPKQIHPDLLEHDQFPIHGRFVAGRQSLPKCFDIPVNPSDRPHETETAERYYTLGGFAVFRLLQFIRMRTERR